MTHWTFTRSDHGGLPNVAAWNISNAQGLSYQIQLAWPLGWSTLQVSAQANLLYSVDGNAVFGTALDAVRRRRLTSPDEPGTVVIAIGYPLTNSVYSPRRTIDLTPPCKTYVPPTGPDGHPRPEPHGGADQFLAFIKKTVEPFVLSSIFPNVTICRTALFGHSYGGLFALHVLFTQPGSFGTFLVASPSIWWNDRLILTEETQFYDSPGLRIRPRVRLSYGSQEQFPARHRGESLDMYERRKRGAAQRRMTDNCDELYERLSSSGRVECEKRVYLDEDHGSVIAPALNGGILFFTD
ncbi:alpha/beta hydrolase [Aspergillus saccharolyticus JOP 1030-1]|uniref:Siderophore esterase IroE-like protein n=1 Tax=Aspergillus saccharolyticus JOP 1030-1 TaxID=1450539 RepID=A0A318Z1D8_9EURO|nr:hypothetical protein BP01DRAFT_350551 [Aspergillus saccharolyticus JOP 1030-1]PYH40816.1 hypothetical protein BP01DRAFT_350551 [Aspergillus saccharolyticus JOP 1030-1]